MSSGVDGESGGRKVKHDNSNKQKITDKIIFPSLSQWSWIYRIVSALPVSCQRRQLVLALSLAVLQRIQGSIA